MYDYSQNAPYILITFANFSQALQMEKACHKAGFPGLIIPTPAEISASCTMSWLAPYQYKENLFALLKNKKLDYENTLQIYR
ncbi:MAG: DUF3343 domain-containing protein [Clostridiales bacterium]